MAEIAESVGKKAKTEDVNLAAWLYGVDDLRMLPLELPKHLGPHDVRVQMKAVGICGSDVHYLKHLRCGDFLVDSPMVLGHESSGIVTEIGDSVKNVKVGDKVALEPGISCAKCTFCKKGRYNLCTEMKFFATPPVHGSLAREIIHPDDVCFPLPPSLSLEEGALCEPLSVALHTCRRAGSLSGCHVAVFGAGPIGLLVAMTSQAMGAGTVVVAEKDRGRLGVAREILGEERVVEVGGLEADEDADVARIRSSLKSRVDVSIDCVGVSQTMRTALKSTDSGGKVLLVGMGHSEMKLPMTGASSREVDIIGVFRYANTYPLCIELLESKKIDVKRLITHRFGFSQEEVVKGFETSAKGGEAIKVMFNL